MLVAALCALPASGDQASLSPAVVAALTPLDTVPSRSDVDSAFTPLPALDNLIAIAHDPTADLGVALHAIRMLPLYCSDTASCLTGTPVHDALFSIIGDGVTALGQAPLAPTDLLRLRAAIEALGATRSALSGDVDLLASPTLLAHPSRDVRVTTVRALRSLNSCQAIGALSQRNAAETVGQVKVAIVAALQSLRLSCTP